MPRTIPAALLEHIQSGAPTLATCVKVTRTDNLVLGFTGVNKDLTIGSILYEAESGLSPSLYRQTSDSGPDNMEIVGLLRSDRIKNTDIEAGFYDNAAVEVFQVNFEDLSMGQFTVMTGTLGDATLEDGKWTFELRSLMQRLSQQLGELTSRLCRVKVLGDSQCKFVLVVGVHINTRNVHSIQSAHQITFASDSNPTDFYSYGTVEMLTGANKGFKREVKKHTLVSGRAQIELQESFPYLVTTLDQGRLTIGCNRTIEQCIARFNNAINFRGEPHLPGTIKVLRRGRK